MRCELAETKKINEPTGVTEIAWRCALVRRDRLRTWTHVASIGHVGKPSASDFGCIFSLVWSFALRVDGHHVGRRVCCNGDVFDVGRCG